MLGYVIAGFEKQWMKKLPVNVRDPNRLKNLGWILYI